MKKSKKMFQLISLMLSILVLVLTTPLPVFANVEFNPADGAYSKPISKKDYAIAPGVIESEIVVNDSSGSSRNVVRVMGVDQYNSNVKVMPSYRNMDPTVWGTQVMSEQAAAAESKLGVNVVGAINVNLRFENDEPMGMLVIDGVVYHEEVTGNEYLAIKKDGTAEIRSGKTPLDENVWQAITTFSRLVKNGKSVYSSVDHSQQNRAPRTAIGIKADGTLVLVEIDGRQLPQYTGVTLPELAEIMISLGCVDAANCDGGGTSTFITEREGTGELVVRNSPSDGAERPTLGGLLVISTAVPSGEFDHASLEPNGEYYTPNSMVEMTATGVDYSGAVANAIPESVTWQIADGYSDMGRIENESISGNTARSIFVSNGTEGDAVINLVNDGKVVGSTTIHINHPDTIAFSSDTVNLDYEAVSSLGLIASYKGNAVNLKPGDINWTIGDSTAGAFDGLYFRATDNYLVSVTTAITATYAYNSALTAEMTLNIGMQPTVVMDGGDNDGLNYSVFGRGAGSAGAFTWERENAETCDITTVHYINTDGTSRGGNESLEHITNESEEWVDVIRFGNKALKLNYDFSNINGIEGACVGFSKPITLTGSPSAIGCWIYAPEGTHNLWLRAAVGVQSADGNFAYTYVNFTDQCAVAHKANPNDYGGINWVGWKYVTADLSAYKGREIRILPGEVIRVMHTNGNYGFVSGKGNGDYLIDGTVVPRSECKGYIVIDNLQFEYGSNNQDVINPVIDSIKYEDINGSEGFIDLEDGTIIDVNEITLRGYFNDNEYTDRYATGVENSFFYLDGQFIGNGHSVSSEGFSWIPLELTNGVHSLTYMIKDGFGNTTKKTVYFTINGSDRYPTVSVTHDDDIEMFLGDTVELRFTTDNAACIKDLSASITMNKNFTVSDVIFADGFTGEWSYTQDDGILEVNLTADGTAASGDTLAILQVKVPTSISEGSKFDWQVTNGVYNLTDDSGIPVSDAFHAGFATKKEYIPVASKYTITSDVLVKGMVGTLHVKDNEGNPAGNVAIYCIGPDQDILVGKTDEYGALTGMYFTEKQSTWTVFAQDSAGAVSFPTKIKSYNPVGDIDGKPYNILHTAADDQTQKKISWMSNPYYTNAQAIARVSLMPDMVDSNIYEGETCLLTYLTDEANIISRVTLTGITPGTTYYYQVGDGTIWSDVRSFTAKPIGGEVDFVVLGDIQAANNDNIGRISNAIKNSDKEYTFGIQIGDTIDDVRDYSEWCEMLEVLANDTFNSLEMIYIIGNHETFSDPEAKAARSIFNLPSTHDKGYYSVEYGNVYVAVIDYTLDVQKMEEALDWLITDANNSDCTWKFLAMHQPPYYTNTAGGNEFINELVPPAAEAACIDIVFSGHDHSYAHTKPMTGGNIDTENGITYYICGSSGKKGYAIVENDAFNFDVINGEYNSTYISVNATPMEINITTYDVNADGTVSVLDTYTKVKTICDEYEHKYGLDSSTGILKCSVCNHVRLLEGYNGLFTDGEDLCYAIDGNKVSGWIYDDGDYYYFDKNTLKAVNGIKTIDGYTYEFVDYKLYNGQWLTTSDGHLVYRWAGSLLCNQWFTLRDKTYYFDANCYAATGPTLILLSIGGDSKWFIFDEFGVLINPVETTGLWQNGDDIYYLIEGVAKRGLWEFEENYYYFGSDYKMRKGGTYYLDKNATHGLVPEGYYYFDNDGKMTDIVAYGTCGENATWSFSRTGTLTISGSGAMNDYATNGAPWNDYLYQIKNIEISRDITYIGKFNFFQCKNLESVVFEPESKLERIGWGAFGYSGLKEITIPASVTKLDDYAFYYCTRLTTVDFEEGSSLTTIGAYAFWNDSALTSMFVPDRVTVIGENAFLSCNNATFNVAEGFYAHNYVASKGFRYVTREAADFIIASGSCGDNVTWDFWSNGELVISGSGAMDNYATNGAPWDDYRYQIKSVEIGKDITYIGKFNFFQCKNLESVVFEPESKLGTIGWGAFGYSGLKEITIPASVTKLDDYAFYCCTRLTTVDFEEGSSLTAIGAYAFWNDSALTSMFVPDRVTIIGENAFLSCNNATFNVAEGFYAHNYVASKGFSFVTREAADFIIASGSCGDDATWDFWSNGKLVISGSGAMDDYATNGAPWDDHRYQIKSIEIGSDITYIGKFNFFQCKNLESVVFEPESKLKRIGWGAFGYSGLKEITIPAAVTTLNDYAFYYCTRLTTVDFEEGSSLTTIGGYAFWNDSALTSMFVPDRVTIIGENAFLSCNNATFNVAEGFYAHNYVASKGFRYVTREAADFIIASGSCGDNVTWDFWSNGELVISGSGAMDNYATNGAPWDDYRYQIKSVEIGKDITYIGKFNFFQCKNLESVVFEPESKLGTIGWGAFGYSGLKEITIPASVTTLDDYAFYYCTRLTTVDFEEGSSLTAIEGYVFWNDSNLEHIIIPASVTYIGENAFLGTKVIVAPLSVESAPVESVPGELIPGEPVPGELAPEEPVPEEPVPEEPVPEEPAPEEPAPEEPTPEEPAPEESTPEEPVPEEPVPEEPTPEEPAPEEPAPEEPTSEEPAPEEPAPEEPAPEEPTPEEPTPEELEPEIVGLVTVIAA